MKTATTCADLIPCPFCGGPGTLTHTSGSYGYYAGKWGAGCQPCGVKTQAFDDEIWQDGKHVNMSEQAKADAIAAWNRRHVSEQKERAPVDRRDPPFDAIDERRSGIDRRQRVAPLQD
ncbi:MAG: Lar family restriction alleviation protein, partial [Pseudomonadota bacterium]